MEWQILHKQKQKALEICPLSSKVFNVSYEIFSWAESTIFSEKQTLVFKDPWNQDR